jgi:hypothetical protein
VAGSIHNLNSQLDHVVEKDIALGTFLDPLEQRLIYGGSYDDVAVTMNDGELFHRYRYENPTAKQDASTPPDNESIDSGLTAGYAKKEKWPAQVKTYDGMTKTNTKAAMVSLEDTYQKDLVWLGKQAALTLDLQERRTINQAYHGGRSYSSENDASATLTVFDLKDINGFIFRMSNGVRQDVSPSTPLVVTITNTNDGTVNRNLIGVTPGTRVDADDTIPGTITLSTPINAIAIGNPVIAATAPPSIRPNGKTTPYNIAAGDKLDFDTVVDAATYLGLNGISEHEDGFYHFIGDKTHFSSLWKNSAFREAYRGRYDSDEFRYGNKVECMGILFDWCHTLAKSTNESSVTVRRAIVTGEGIAERYYYKDEPDYVDREIGPLFLTMFDPDTHIKLITRRPIVAKADVFTTTWEALLGHACPTNSLSNFGEHINSIFKNGVGIQTS